MNEIIVYTKNWALMPPTIYEAILLVALVIAYITIARMIINK